MLEIKWGNSSVYKPATAFLWSATTITSCTSFCWSGDKCSVKAWYHRGSEDWIPAKDRSTEGLRAAAFFFVLLLFPTICLTVLAMDKINHYLLSVIASKECQHFKSRGFPKVTHTVVTNYGTFSPDCNHSTSTILLGLLFAGRDKQPSPKVTKISFNKNELNASQFSDRWTIHSVC